MKKYFLITLCFFFYSAGYAQVTDAYYLVDYSNAVICGMDTEAFSVIETDWDKDNPEISGNILQDMLKKTGDIIPFKKDSKNKVIVIVRIITDNGRFTCDVALYDANNNVLCKAENIQCSKGGTWGTKLHLMKEGAHKEGRKLGSALKKAYKNYMSTINPKPIQQ